MVSGGTHSSFYPSFWSTQNCSKNKVVIVLEKGRAASLDPIGLVNTH